MQMSSRNVVPGPLGDEGCNPLPHPSPRNNIWLSKNRWFENEVVPVLRERVASVLRGR